MNACICMYLQRVHQLSLSYFRDKILSKPNVTLIIPTLNWFLNLSLPKSLSLSLIQPKRNSNLNLKTKSQPSKRPLKYVKTTQTVVTILKYPHYCGFKLKLALTKIAV